MIQAIILTSISAAFLVAMGAPWLASIGVSGFVGLMAMGAES